MEIRIDFVPILASMKTLFISFVLGIVYSQAIAQTIPKNLLIYYGYPSLINGANGNLTNAATTFKQYQYVVLGEGLEQTGHDDHANTQTIITNIKSNVKVFGYIWLGRHIAGRTPWTNAEVRDRVNLWKTMGVHGIFLDDYGYAQNVTRARQDSAVRYIHAQGLSVFVNTADIEEVFGNAVHANNPSQMPSPIDNRDFYLWESYVVIGGKYYGMYLTFSEWEYWRVKSDNLRAYQTTSGFKIMSITTPDFNGTFDANKWNFTWYSAWLQGHEATGWGEKNYSASSPAANSAPFRTRPSIASPGSVFLSGVQNTGNEFFRWTDTGKIWADTTTKTAGFTLPVLCQSMASGVWTNAAIWSCGHVPYPFDDVLIKTPHVVSVTSSMGEIRCRNFSIQRGATFTATGNFKADRR